MDQLSTRVLLFFQSSMADEVLQDNPALETPAPDNIHHDDDAPPSKRRKIPLACSTCRDKKSRCDGKRPTCSACAKRKTATKCEYEESTLKTQRDIAILESRVRELEGIKTSSIFEHEEPTVRLQHGNFLQENTRPRDGLPLDVVLHHPRKCSEEDANLKSMTHITSDLNDALAIVPLDADGAHLFGTTSSASFLHSLKKTIAPTHGIDTAHASQSSTINSRVKQNSSKLGHGSDTISFFLPTRKQADRYTDCFWQFVHPIAPILHKTSFISLYLSIWLPLKQQNRDVHSATEDLTFLSTLSIMFAIGCQYDESIEPSRKAVLAERFYHQSRSLIMVDELDSVSLLTVQLLLLTGIYLLNSKYTNRCWNIIGLAIRNAQTLCLHEDNNKQGNQIRRETRRRVWYYCVYLDRLVAMIFGRPHMISSSTRVPLPILMDDEYLLSDGEGRQPVNTVSYLGLFLWSLKLFDIMSEVLALSNRQKEDATQSNEAGIPWWRSHLLDDILKIDRTLDHFLETLPSHLRPQQISGENRTDDRDNMQWRQAKILQCRRLYVRALLLRPVLLSAAQAHKSNPFHPATSSNELGERVATQVCIKCIETVHELVTAIYSSLHVNYQSPEWVTHYTFSCAMVLAAARICSFTDLDALQLSWSRCIAILLHYKEHIPSAPYAVQVLETLQQRGVSRTANDDEVGLDAPELNEFGGIEDFNVDWSYPLPDDLGEFDFNWMGHA
ncbi:uncharacterized protein LY89DRAFT_715544 [Mollisia scopiformis]|uniref:Zn(2)-C6 fungal-type domain-containing protein n=1 Tax=Mollisia scopiformis TaxID=149040 RepID=A0A194XMI0_MOLSC|nr:uncharacterized protein LY89DRAFT_715544 [Mollisia scopiformis]KUJ21336.1 hypothetical protein LY89DRAFT_715544 [Mollisia scopiformis]